MPGELAGGDGGADARAADEHAALGVAGEDRLADLARLVRVVDADGVGVRPEVDDVVAESRELLEHTLPQLDAAVVERDRHPHTGATLPTWTTFSSGASSDSSSASTPCAARPRPSPATRPRGCPRADLMAVLARQVPALRLRRARPGDERPARLLEGPRVDAPLRDVPRRGRDLRRGADDVPPVRLDPRGAPDAAHPLGGRRHRLARPGPADRGRDGDRRQVPRPAARTASGCSAATARRPRARSGRRSSTRRTTSSTT